MLNNKKSKYFNIQPWYYSQRVTEFKQCIEKLCISHIRFYSLLKQQSYGKPSYQTKTLFATLLNASWQKDQE
jgi:hypothetical protein